MIQVINPKNGDILSVGENGYYFNEKLIFPKVRGAYRTVTENNYTDSFGFQWNRFEKTQIDRFNNNVKISEQRLFSETLWPRDGLQEENILEVGSGAGRFTEVILNCTKANLYSLDYSDAVSANAQNNAHHCNRLHLFQASVYEMPFPDNSFDKVICLGVLQHTPDFKESVRQLIKKVRPGGEVTVDFYTVNGWWTKLHSKYIFRPITKKMNHERLLNLIDRNADRLIGAYKFFDRIGLGKIVNRFIPVVDIKGTIPPELSKQELREWVILDTFDMFSPEHDHPQKISTVANWFKEFGMEISFAGQRKYGESGFVANVVQGIKK